MTSHKKTKRGSTTNKGNGVGSGNGGGNGGGWMLFMLVLIVGMLVGLYVLVIRPQKDVKQAIQTLRTSVRKALPFGGPYEQCEDMVCPAFEGKAECMKTKAEDIKKCCQSVCHSKCVHLPEPALEECLQACSPMF